MVALDELKWMMSDEDDEHGAEFLHVDRIAPERRLHVRPDLCAFLLLARLCPGTRDMVTSAEHDQIWLDPEPEAVAAAAQIDDIRDLVRCGVFYDAEVDSLSMFA